MTIFYLFRKKVWTKVLVLIKKYLVNSLYDVLKQGKKFSLENPDVPWELSPDSLTTSLTIHAEA